MISFFYSLYLVLPKLYLKFARESQCVYQYIHPLFNFPVLQQVEMEMVATMPNRN